LTAANGDELFWTEAISPGNIDRTFTGGTGRFKNAGGGFSYEITPDVVVIVIDGVPCLIIVTFRYRATGTITY